jgi:hypothetical protein
MAQEPYLSFSKYSAFVDKNETLIALTFSIHRELPARLKWSRYSDPAALLADNKNSK